MIVEPKEKDARVITLRYPLHPKQEFAFNSPATEQLYGGSAGSGKSFWLRICLIMWCFMIPGLQCYLFRRLYADLWANHMEGPKSFPILLGDSIQHGLVTITGHRITFYNGSKIFLNHLQYSKHLTKYHGPEMHVIAFDELTHFEEAQYQFLRSRLRMVGMGGRIPKHLEGRFPRIIAGSNPGNIGHHWVKKMFIGERMGDIEPKTIFQQPRNEGGMWRQFIPALLDDNPSLIEDDPDYENKLSGLGDPVLVRAYREGDWDIVAGSMFGDTWRENTEGNEPWHVCDPFEIPSGWPLWRGADDGIAAPFSCHWLTQNPDTETYYVIDELYRKGMMPLEVAERVKEKDLLIPVQGGRNTEILRGMLDNAAFANTGQATITRGDQMNNLGCRWIPVEKFPGSRIARVQNFHRLLKPNEKERYLKPHIIFFRTCRDAIKTIPAIMRSEKDIEDVNDDSELHAFDSATYALQYRRPLSGRIALGGI